MEEVAPQQDMLFDVAIPTRRCVTCGEEKPLDQWTRQRRTGKFPDECSTCWLRTLRRRSNEKPDRILKIRDHHLRSAYGISLADYDAMLQAQDGVCAICGQQEVAQWGKSKGKPQTQRLCVDHDHDTGRVRGLLCTHCNSGIGHLMHDISILESAIQYLRASLG